MVVYVNIRQATFRKLDRSATNEVTTTHAAAADAGRFNKQIIDKDALAPIQQIVTQARQYLYDHTLPWSDNGDRVLSSMNYFEVMDKLNEYQRAFNAAVDDFCTTYNQHRDRARLKLNSLFRDADYPNEQEVRTKFAFNFGVLPLPTAGDFRVAMASDEVNEVRAEIQKQLDDRVQSMMSTVWEELRGTISLVKDRCGNAARLHESVLANLTDLVDRLPGLNITCDTDLEALRQEIKRTFAHYDIKDLRKDEQVRKAVSDEADRILKQMAGLV